MLVFVAKVSCSYTTWVVFWELVKNYGIISNVFFIIARTTANANCSDGDLRLRGGTTSWEGWVEMCYGCQWVTVWDDLWESNDAKVACRQLGFSCKNMCTIQAVIRLCENLILQFRSTGLCQCMLWSWNWVHTLGQCEIYWGRIKAVRLLQCWSRCL